MNIKEAAEYLEISVKTLERKIAAGDVSVAYVPGATGKQRTFDRNELDRFKQAEEAKTAATTYVARRHVAPVAGDENEPQQKLQRVETMQAMVMTLGEEVRNTLQNLVALQNGKSSAVPVADKLTLSLALST